MIFPTSLLIKSGTGMEPSSRFKCILRNHIKQGHLNISEAKTYDLMNGAATKLNMQTKYKMFWEKKYTHNTQTSKTTNKEH